jgi:hypothetical protein
MEKGSIINIISFTLYLDQWLRHDETIDFLSDENIKHLYEKWNIQWLPSLNESHCGDCTNVPCACTRCHTENFLNQATRIYNIIEDKNA